MGREDGGFTLIEVLIVIVIVGVLATVVTVSVVGVTNDAEESGCAADARVLSNAAEAYFAQRGADLIPAADGTLDGYEKTLVAEKFIRSPSVLHNLDEHGHLLQVAGSPCTI